MNYFLRFVSVSFLLISCTSQKNISFSDTSHLKLVGQYDIPYNKSFRNTIIGGLSGIDYDAKHKIYYLISDDRSEFDASRFYSAKISFGSKGIDSVAFVSVNNMLQPDGTVYPNSKQDPYHAPDPEAMRYNPKTNQLVWSSEGERIVRKEGVVLEDPSIRIINRQGKYIDSFVLPSNMHMQPVEKGPRRNGVFEGISFNQNYNKLFVSVEEPLYEDGPRAGLYDSTGWVRFIKFDVKTRTPEAEYAYKIDPVAYPANPPGAFKINGVPDILAINDHQLLVIERSFSTGRMPCTIKVYLAELGGASNVLNTGSLQNGVFTPITKRLVVNMDDLGIYIDNIEGMTFGPKLPGGHPSLIFVSDNNFSKEEVTQLLLFEVQ